MKALKISLDEWQKILIEISKHHPRSVWMVRSKMRRILGFTPREHRDHEYNHMVHLDFYDEAQKTMFLLKYSNFIDTNKNDRQVY